MFLMLVLKLKMMKSLASPGIDLSSDSDGKPSPLKSSKGNGQTGEATEKDLASYADDQQKPPSVTAQGQAPGMFMYFGIFFFL